MLTPRTDLVAVAALVAENAALREENATLRLRADSQRIMAACSAASAAGAPIPSIPADHDCDSSGYIELNIGHWLPHAPNGVGGTVTPGTYTGSSANYLVSGGRVGGAWDLTIKRILVDDSIYGNDIEGPTVVDVRGQTSGPEPLALLHAALGGHLPAPGDECIYGLTEHEFAFLAALSPEGQALVIAGLQDDAEHGAMREFLTIGGEAYTPTDRALGQIDADA
jgi:hypothetical protein